jgi:hypothetical protein
MGDLPASGPYPGTTYTPLSPEVNGVYHEDREVTLLSGVGGSQMYRVYNATFDSTSQTWTPKSSLPAYATVQGADGSIHHYKLNSSGTWDGSGNNTVYNAVDFGMSAANANNGPALQKAVDAVIAGGGGTLFIPAGSYTFTSGIIHNAVTGDDVGLIIAGASGGTELKGGTTLTGPLFTFSEFSSVGNGIRFQNLRITYSSASATGPAISIASSQNVTCREVFFHNCPQAFSADDGSLQCGLIDCTIVYELIPPPLTTRTMVSLAGSQDFVRGCVIRQNSAATGCYAIKISSNDGMFIDNNHISDFDYGLLVIEGTEDSFIANSLFNVNVCGVLIKPSDDTGKINNLVFSNCVFAETLTGGTGASGNSGVIITTLSTNSADDSNVAGIVFSNCIAYGWGGAGIEVDSGQNIVISGGQYSSNGQKTTVTNLMAGIAIAGGTDVTITGADCSGVNWFWQHKGAGAKTQPAGIAMSNNVESVASVVVDCCNLQGNFANAVLVAQSGTFTINTALIKNCNASGYSSYSAAVNVTGTATALQVVGSAGYNDQNAPLNLGHVPTAPGISAATCSTPYFGPSIVSFSNPNGSGGWNSLTVNISGVDFKMGFGSIYLPRDLDEIYFSGTPAENFRWTGK